MKSWFDRSSAEAKDDIGNLNAPLLRHGSSFESDASGHPPQHPGTAVAAHAFAQAEANARGPARGRTSSEAARQRRRQRMHRVREHMNSTTSEMSDADFAGGISVASDAETQKASNIGTEDTDDSSEVTDYGNADEGGVPRTPGAIARSAGVAVLTGCGVAAYAISLVFVGTVMAASTAAMSILGVAGGVCVVMAPLVLMSEWTLALMPGMRRSVNELRSESDRLRAEVDLLAKEEEGLREEAKDLEDVQEQLERVVERQNGGNVDDFVELVRQNETILQDMKENLRQVAIQGITKLVLQCDLTNDFKLCRKEAQLLETRLALTLEVYGIVFDAERFRRAVGLSPSLPGVMKIIRRLLPDANGEIYSSTMMSDEESEFEEGEDDPFDMFYIPVKEEFRMGSSSSIQLAREYLERTGERPDLMSLSQSMMKSVRGFRRSDMMSSRLSSSFGSEGELGSIIE